MKKLFFGIIISLVTSSYAVAATATIENGDVLACYDQYVRKDGSVIRGTLSARETVTFQVYNCQASGDAGNGGFCDRNELAYVTERSGNTGFDASAISTASLEVANIEPIINVAAYANQKSASRLYFYLTNDLTKPVVANVPVKDFPGAPETAFYRVTCGIERFGFSIP